MTMLAGWLFADLFLILLVAGLTTLPAKSSGEPATRKPTPTAPPTPPPPAHPVGLDPNHIDLTVAMSPNTYRAGGADALLAQVNAQLDQKDPTHRAVGFVLVFASDDQAHVQRANDTAEDVFQLLHTRSKVFAAASGFGYWNGNHNNFEFKIFLLN
ncbi:hypothetical protein [Actinocrispum wychmicini]|nr:hypothetical protein [Actinocrispum wychmicini]